MQEPKELKLSSPMEGALLNLLAGKPWDRGLHWGRGHTAASVRAGLSATMPALLRRGLVDEQWDLTLKGRQVANALKAQRASGA